MQEVKFVVLGEPKAKQRPKFAAHKSKDGEKTFAKAYTPKQTVMYENLVRLSYQRDVGVVKLNGEIAAKILAVFPIPKSTSKKNRQLMLERKILHTKKIDCDNLAKIILDSLNGIAYDDDKQICKLFVEKVYGEQPRVEVIMDEINADDKFSMNM